MVTRTRRVLESLGRESNESEESEEWTRADLLTVLRGTTARQRLVEDCDEAERRLMELQRCHPEVAIPELSKHVSRVRTLLEERDRPPTALPPEARPRASWSALTRE